MIHTLTHRFKHIAKNRIGPLVARRQPIREDLSLDTWDLAVGPNGTLWSGGLDLEALAQQHGTPLHVVRGDALERNAREALAGCDGSADIFYSYKTNPVPEVLRRLDAVGVGAEVISPYELWLALRLGVAPERIIYNGPAKSDDSLRLAIERGVYLINANSVSEAERIAAIAADVGQPVNLGLRIALPGGWGGQFGIASSSPKLLPAIKRALEDPLVDLRGLHVHRGGTLRSEAAFLRHVHGVLAACDDIRSETGWHPQQLDIGGSLACPTVAAIPMREYRLNRALGTDLLAPDPDAAIRVGHAASLAVTVVSDHFEPLGLPVPLVILEPGRALTGDTQFLLAMVIDVKDDSELIHVVLDTGINVAEPVANEYHQLFSVSTPTAPATTNYRLVGPICTPADVLYNNWRLPPPRPGDVLAIMDSGAYFVPFSTAFSFPRAGIVVQDGASVRQCRRAETFDDLVALDALAPEQSA